MSVCLVVCLFSHSDSLGSTHDFFQIHCSFSFYCSHARCPLNPTSNLSMPPPSERRTSQSTLWGGYKGLVNLPVLCSPPIVRLGATGSKFRSSVPCASMLTTTIQPLILR